MTKTATLHECPNCEYTTSKTGAFNLHKYHCDFKQLKGGDKTNVKESKKKEKECDHDWRFLNPRNATEKRALLENYSMVCTKCGDLEE